MLDKITQKHIIISIKKNYLKLQFYAKNYVT